MGLLSRRKTYGRCVFGSLTLAIGGTVALCAPAQGMTNGAPVADADLASWVATLDPGTDGSLSDTAGCGGALVTSDRVVTAAHCIDGQDPRRTRVHINSRVLSRDPGIIRTVRGVAILPGYRQLPSPAAPDDEDYRSARYDVAVLLLDQPVTEVPPLPIAPHRPEVGDSITLFAHGLTGGHGPSVRNDALYHGELRAISQQTCAAATPAVVDSDSVLCGRDQAGAVSACWRDSGSPAVSFAHGRPELVGTVSFGGEVSGKPCSPKEPTAFADIAKIRSWVLGPLPERAPFPQVPVPVTRTGRTLNCGTPQWDTSHTQPPENVTVDWVAIMSRGADTRQLPIPGADTAHLNLTEGLRGLTVACRVHARTPGGSTMTLSQTTVV